MNAMSVLNAKMMAKAKAQKVLMKVLQEMMPAEVNNAPVRLEQLPVADTTSDVRNAPNPA